MPVTSCGPLAARLTPRSSCLSSMPKSGPGWVVMYRWRLRPELETSFVDAWCRVTEQLLSMGGSLGSRLHRGSDGLWYGYAQWPDEVTRQRAFARSLDAAAGAQMQAAIVESLPEVILEAVADYLILADGARK